MKLITHFLLVITLNSVECRLSSNRYTSYGSNRNQKLGFFNKNSFRGSNRNRLTTNSTKNKEIFETSKHSFLSNEDFERAKHLPEALFNGDDKILYSGDYFEGDIAENLLVNDSKGKNALRNPESRWPGGVIPYMLSPTYSNEERAVIARAIQEYHDKTCVKFRPYTSNDNNYLFIKPGIGCSSRVGMTGGMQQVSLSKGCIIVGIVEHELMHAIGFVHEQSRADRDEYVQIIYKNIRRGLENNFRKYSIAEIEHLNEPYDYNSVLHYSANAFSNGQGPTIVPRRRGAEIGQRRGFSEIDLRKINKLYECNSKPSSGIGSRPSFGSIKPEISSGISFRPSFGSIRPGISSEIGSRPSFGSIKPEISNVISSRPVFGSRPSNFLTTILGQSGISIFGNRPDFDIYPGYDSSRNNRRTGKNNRESNRSKWNK